MKFSCWKIRVTFHRNRKKHEIFPRLKLPLKNFKTKIFFKSLNKLGDIIKFFEEPTVTVKFCEFLNLIKQKKIF